MPIFKTGTNETEILNDLLVRLRSEYEIIQGKIDNIGDFKFKVRGWLITIYSAFLFGIFSGQVSVTLCIPLGLFIVSIFFFLEREQLILQLRLSNRAKKIEKAVYVLTQRIYEFGTNKDRLIKSILKEVESSPRIGVIITSGQHLTKFRFEWSLESLKKSKGFLWQEIVSFGKAYWLFIVLFIATIVTYFICSNQELNERWSVIRSANDSTSEHKIVTGKVNNNMRENLEIERVEEEMSSLVSQVDFGDISDIDAYWESLAEALLDLPIKNWLNRPLNDSDVADIVNSIDVPTAGEVCELARKMKALCDSGSNSSISEENLAELQRMNTVFERKFDMFLDELDNLMKEE